jgi:hypothetical protein
MDRARVAEWILSLVLSPERAASAVGDFSEDAGERGSFWFWSCVVRTAISGVWGDFVESPGFMLGLALRGNLFGIFLTVATVALCIPIVSLIAAAVDPFLPVRTSPRVEEASEILGTLAILAWAAACEFLTGWWIARRARGKEMAAVIIARVAWWVFFSLVGFVVMHFWGSEINRVVAGHPDNSGWHPAKLLARFPDDIFLFAGALWVRRKSTRSVAQ